MARGVPIDSVVLGGGSSEIIHRVLPRFVGAGPVTLLDPTYSEYGFVLTAHGIEVRRFKLDVEHDFNVDVGALASFSSGSSCVVLVNPNNPTGRTLDRNSIAELLDRLEPRTSLWIDEAYVDYVDGEVSVERNAAEHPRILALKSLSKGYALSGIRAAYGIAHPDFALEVRASTPPWIIGTPALAACVAALSCPDYYRAKYRETRELRRRFRGKLEVIGRRVWEGDLNAVLVQARSAQELADRLAQAGVFVRTPVGMGSVLGDEFVRIAVLPPREQDAILEVLTQTVT